MRGWFDFWVGWLAKLGKSITWLVPSSIKVGKRTQMGGWLDLQAGWFAKLGRYDLRFCPEHCVSMTGARLTLCRWVMGTDARQG